MVYREEKARTTGAESRWRRTGLWGWRPLLVVNWTEAQPFLLAEDWPEVQASPAGGGLDGEQPSPADQ